MANIIYSRAILFSDESGIETGVSFNPTDHFCDDGLSYVEIQGVGESTSVRLDHIPHLIQWLEEIQAVDVAYRADRRAKQSEGKE